MGIELWLDAGTPEEAFRQARRSRGVAWRWLPGFMHRLWFAQRLGGSKALASSSPIVDSR